ncbi:fluoride efflux transporter FluC [Nonomuraea harbinensis]|uniref:Fluoride-specific ion channel FluC n=1 Tax=Nonomuraea harbinensis TaxID=1286938 RepID=A0ABW1BNT0_9ACTN|nr:CrcB family protein [Nonomuraea harbinensis]
MRLLGKEYVAAIAAGGATGALARLAVEELLPAAPGGFPWATFGVNAAGCALIGVLMVVVSEGRVSHRLARPFLGTGVLGGFTTFSTYAVQAHGLLAAGTTAVAAAYLAGTMVAAVAATWAGMRITRALVRR